MDVAMSALYWKQTNKGNSQSTTDSFWPPKFVYSILLIESSVQAKSFTGSKNQPLTSSRGWNIELDLWSCCSVASVTCRLFCTEIAFNLTAQPCTWYTVVHQSSDDDQNYASTTKWNDLAIVPSKYPLQNPETIWPACYAKKLFSWLPSLWTSKSDCSDSAIYSRTGGATPTSIISMRSMASPVEGEFQGVYDRHGSNSCQLGRKINFRMSLVLAMSELPCSLPSNRSGTWWVELVHLALSLTRK